MACCLIVVVPRGGNEAHLSPEILNTRPKPGNFLNYSKQPVWEAGVLAYELAGHRSPFKQSSIDQRAYNASALPSLIATRSQVWTLCNTLIELLIDLLVVAAGISSYCV